MDKCRLADTELTLQFSVQASAEPSDSIYDINPTS